MSIFSEKFKSFFVKNGQEKALLTKQAIAIIICLAVFIAGIAVYFIWAKPAEETAGKPDHLYDGETFIDSTGVLLLFPQYTRNDIESISISNALEKYKLNAFVEEGYSRHVVDGSVIYIKTSSLLDIAGDTEHKLDKNSGLASYIVKDGVTEESLLSDYGIDLDSGKTVSVDENGKKHVFMLGTKTDITGGANYYVVYSPEKGASSYAVYMLVTLSSSTQFAIEGFEDTTLDPSNVAAVVVASTVVPTVAPSTKNFRVTENATYEELVQYGLDDGSSPSKVTVSLINGTEYTFRLGSKIPSGGGYYARVEGRMNGDGYIVYIIGNTTANTFLCESTALLDTLVVTAVGSDVESITDFRFYRIAGSDKVRSLVLQAAAATESTKTADTSAYTMVYPTAYKLDEDQYYDGVVSSIAYIYASSVVSFGDRIHTEEIYSKFGLDLDKERLADGTDKNHAKIMFAVKEDPTEDDYSVVYFSEKMTGSDGAFFYYVYSPEFEAIYNLSADGFEFVDWTLARFTRGNLYFNYINCADYFELISHKSGDSVRYTMSGNEKTLQAIVTEAGENGKPLTRIDLDGKTVPGEFKTQYENKVIGTYTTTEYFGDFEELRSLFYVLITRSLSLDADSAGLTWLLPRLTRLRSRTRQTISLCPICVTTKTATRFIIRTKTVISAQRRCVTREATSFAATSSSLPPTEHSSNTTRHITMKPSANSF